MSWEYIRGKCYHCGKYVLIDEGLVIDENLPKKYCCDTCFESEMRSHYLTDQMENDFNS